MEDEDIEQKPEFRKARFYSKIRQLTVVIRPGRSNWDSNGNMINATPGLHAAFEEGIYDIDSDNEYFEEVCKALRKHKQYGHAFFEAKEVASDPMSGKRLASEPGHVIQEYADGGRGKLSGDLPKQQSQVLMEAAKSMATVMAKEMMVEMFTQMKKEQETKKEAKAPAVEVKEAVEKSPEAVTTVAGEGAQSEAKAPFCTSCSSAGRFHKKGCPTQATDKPLEQ